MGLQTVWLRMDGDM